MENEKKNEILKAVALTILTICVFGAAFFGVNRLALASASGRATEAPPIEAMSSLPASAAMLASDTDSGEGFAASLGAALSAEEPPRRNLTVIETEFDALWWGNSNAEGVNTLSAEDAAQIGARHIYEIYGECIDGATVQMSFNGHLRHRGTPGVWTGTVGDGIPPVDISVDGVDLEFPLGTLMFIFMLNGETGEAIHVEKIANLSVEMIVLNPRSDEGITMELPGWFVGESPFDGERREFFIHPVDADQLDELYRQGIQWHELPLEDMIRIDDLEELLRDHENSGVPSIIISRLTLFIPEHPASTAPHQPHNGDGNGQPT